VNQPFAAVRRALFHRITLASLLVVAASAGVALRHRAAGGGADCERTEHAACAMPGHAGGSDAKKDSNGAANLPDGAAVIMFTSEYCPACRRLEPVLEEARAQCLRAGAPVVRLDVESTEGGALAAKWNVTGTPTLVFLDARHEEISRLVGAQPIADVRHAIEGAFGLVCAAAPTSVRPG
jgi:thiol-disulfide isomerase/thioredoxin